MKLSDRTLEGLAKMVCGDTRHFPYRKGWELTKFFKRCGFPFGSTFLRARRTTAKVPPTITVNRYASQNIHLSFLAFEAVSQFTNVCLARIRPQEGGHRPGPRHRCSPRVAVPMPLPA